MLPTPASLAGSQLPLDSAFHMAQTDVNTAFYRILAPSGYVRIFHFAKCVHSVAPSYMCYSPRSFATLDRRLSTTSGLFNGFLLGALFLSEDGEELRSGSWFFGGRNAHGSSPGPCDDSGIDLFRGLR